MHDPLTSTGRGRSQELLTGAEPMLRGDGDGDGGDGGDGGRDETVGGARRTGSAALGVSRARGQPRAVVRASAAIAARSRRR